MIAAVGLGMPYKVQVLSPDKFVENELFNASVVYRMRKNWKPPQPVNFYDALKMQSNKVPVGFVSDKLVKYAISAINNDKQPFKVNVSFDSVREMVSKSYIDSQSLLYPISGTFSPGETLNKHGFRSPFTDLLEFNISLKSIRRYFVNIFRAISN